MTYRVYIGVGHGGRDPGAVGKVVEKDANLVIALEMKRVLGERGIEVGISRTTDMDGTTAASAVAANEFGADLAVEVHNNAGGGNGFEVYIPDGCDDSRAAAECVEMRVVELGQKSRGIKTKLGKSGKDYYLWHRETTMPALLLEGFFVDSSDADDFDTPEKQQALGRAYALGVLDYFGIDENIKTNATMDKPILDNTPDSYAVDAVAKATARGILRGDDKGNLMLHSPLTRQDFLVMVDRMGLLG